MLSIKFSLNTKLKMIRLVMPAKNIKNNDFRDFACSRITRIGGVFKSSQMLGKINPSKTITLVKMAIGKGPSKSGITEKFNSN
ncbi:hypothetical protein D3C72_1638540 [compost metagenome]